MANSNNRSKDTEKAIVYQQRTTLQEQRHKTPQTEKRINGKLLQLPGSQILNRGCPSATKGQHRIAVQRKVEKSVVVLKLTVFFSFQQTVSESSMAEISIGADPKRETMKEGVFS